MKLKKLKIIFGQFLKLEGIGSIYFLKKDCHSSFSNLIIKL